LYREAGGPLIFAVTSISQTQKCRQKSPSTLYDSQSPLDFVRGFGNKQTEGPATRTGRLISRDLALKTLRVHLGHAFDPEALECFENGLFKSSLRQGITDVNRRDVAVGEIEVSAIGFQ